MTSRRYSSITAGSPVRRTSSGIQPRFDEETTARDLSHDAARAPTTAPSATHAKRRSRGRPAAFEPEDRIATSTAATARRANERLGRPEDATCLCTEVVRQQDFVSSTNTTTVAFSPPRYRLSLCLSLAASANAATSLRLGRLAGSCCNIAATSCVSSGDARGGNGSYSQLVMSFPRV